MKISLKKINNIDNGEIKINENKLNIKYAINGTGKSSISQSLLYWINDKNNGTNELKKLTPFKYLSDDTFVPVVDCDNDIKSIRIFNEGYINEFVFKSDELLKGSFDIFIKDSHYEEGLSEIEEKVSQIRIVFSEHDEIQDLLNDFAEISNSFGRQVKSGIHGSSPLAKSFKNGNKVENIPVELIDFKDFIQAEDNYKWIKWQNDGKSFVERSEKCPCCTNPYPSMKQKILTISNIYDPKSIENLNKIIAAFSRLDKYFSESTREKISEFVKNVEGYTSEQIEYLLEVKEQIDRLSIKFHNAQNFGFFKLKDLDKFIEGLKEYKIDISLYNHLNSSITQDKVKILNYTIDKMLEKAGELQGAIVKQKTYIHKLIRENQNEINQFLRYAGYKYHVSLIEEDNEQYKLKLFHTDASEIVSDVKTHLSYGERNAFALVLFMYDVLKDLPDLIVLDDPISSFDKTKKYAIVDFLFRKQHSLRNKTVIMFTHDIDPVIDMIIHHSNRFDPPVSTFIENNKGILIEKEICKNDIKTFIDICNECIEKSTNSFNKLVYLRRYYEITNNISDAYNVISNLLHKREKLIKIVDTSNMSDEEIQNGTQEIINKIPEFDYNELLNQIKDDNYLIRKYHDSTINYEKLHIFRIFFDDKQEPVESDIIKKFINEAFHIENDYIYQVSPMKYQLVPQYVIDECDRILSEYST